MTQFLSICAKNGCGIVAEFKGYCGQHARVEFPEVFQESAKRKEYYSKHAEELKAKMKEYYSKHAEELKAKMKEYRSKPEVKAKMKEYYSKHAEELKAKMKEYYSKPEVKAKRKEYYSKPERKRILKAKWRSTHYPKLTAEEKLNKAIAERAEHLKRRGIYCRAILPKKYLTAKLVKE